MRALRSYAMLYYAVLRCAMLLSEIFYGLRYAVLRSNDMVWDLLCCDMLFDAKPGYAKL